MTTDTTQTASAEVETKQAQPLEQPEAKTETPASEQSEQWDQARAMDTIHKLREIEKKAKQDAKEFERLKAEEQKRIDAQLTETERLSKQAEELRATNAKLQSDILRRDVIAETGLPAQLADRLKGDTKDELLADAEELLKILPQTKTNPKLQATNPANGSIAETEAQKRERLFGTNNNVFDIKTIQAGGGGVVWHNQKE